MNESILTSTKKLLGIDEEYKHFDPDIIMHINAVFMTLTQIGVGPKEGFMITDEMAEWTDFIPEGPLLNTIKSYMYLRVRQLFDPLLTSSVSESMNRIISEFEWRISVAVDPGKEEHQNEQ